MGVKTFILLFSILISCNELENRRIGTTGQSSTSESAPVGNTIESRFPAPPGFERLPLAENSFGQFLRQFPLKPTGSPVYLFDGRLKSRQDVHVAVLDLDVGERNLQQCPDAVMRLRAEFLFSQKRYRDIHFHFTNGFCAEYARWQAGDRIVVEGNRTYWRTNDTASASYEDFRDYLDLVFTYAGTLSLEKELSPVTPENLAVGDVFIQGGSPGHAVIVVDIAVNASGEKAFLLAQSYMPAQEVHVLKNPAGLSGSPWYYLENKKILKTPEWSFLMGDLKRF
jgi:hypothetical protein